jgi:hypothetical protein
LKESEKHGVWVVNLKLENLTKIKMAKVLIASLISEEYVHYQTLTPLCPSFLYAVAHCSYSSSADLYQH